MLTTNANSSPNQINNDKPCADTIGEVPPGCSDSAGAPDPTTFLIGGCAHPEYEPIVRVVNACQNQIYWQQVKIGQILCDAKQSLPLELWRELFLHNSLPFGIRAAQILIRIAEHPVFGREEFSDRVPRTISAVNELVDLDEATILWAIENGKIYSRMTIAEAKNFARLQRPVTTATETESVHPPVGGDGSQLESSFNCPSVKE
jgi:hypothetical protein